MSSPQVLIVEDEAELAEIYASWIDQAYETTVVNSGTEARDILDERFDVVFLDRRIPFMTGDEVLQEIRSRNLPCRVAMLTAVAPDFDIIEMGFDEYLVKPVSSADLLETVERLLKRAEYEQKVQRLFSLSEKRTILRHEKSPDELAASDAYDHLMKEIEAMREELDLRHTELDTDDYRALMGDLSEPSTVSNGP